MILGVACGTMGGYPHVAHVITADLDRIGQARPGDVLRFRRIETAEARRIDRSRASCSRRVFPVRGHAGRRRPRRLPRLTSRCRAPTTRSFAASRPEDRSCRFRRTEVADFARIGYIVATPFLRLLRAGQARWIAISSHAQGRTPDAARLPRRADHARVRRVRARGGHDRRLRTAAGASVRARDLRRDLDSRDEGHLRTARCHARRAGGTRGRAEPAGRRRTPRRVAGYPPPRRLCSTPHWPAWKARPHSPPRHRRSRRRRSTRARSRNRPPSPRRSRTASTRPARRRPPSPHPSRSPKRPPCPIPRRPRRSRPRIRLLAVATGRSREAGRGAPASRRVARRDRKASSGHSRSRRRDGWPLDAPRAAAGRAGQGRRGRR